MEAFVEFALFAWVGVSIIAVLIQLIRLARYKRSSASTPTDHRSEANVDTPTIDLDQRLAAKGSTDVATSAARTAATSTSAASASTASVSTASTSSASAAPPEPARADAAPAAQPAPVPDAPTPTPAPSPAVAPAPVAPTAAITPPSAPEAAAADPETTSTTAEPSPPEEERSTLAELLAGVRLPWNLLPTVDQSREPSNDRVVLITSEGEPSEIGVDVADELERIGFTITPRGDDTAIASKQGYALGLQIIPDPKAAMVDGAPRFPSATEDSVALDIWIE